MTCPVVLAANMDEGEPEVVKVFTEKENGEGWTMVNLLVDGVEVEEVMHTLEDQQMVSRGVEAKWKTRQRLRNSTRKEVEKLIRTWTTPSVGHRVRSCLCRIVLRR